MMRKGWNRIEGKSKEREGIKKSAGKGLKFERKCEAIKKSLLSLNQNTQFVYLFYGVFRSEFAGAAGDNLQRKFMAVRAWNASI